MASSKRTSSQPSRTRATTKSTAQPDRKPAPPAPPHTHFTPEALKFLRGLANNNRREWFEPRKPIFERELKQPMLEIIEQVTAAMADFSPAHMRPRAKVHDAHLPRYPLLL